MPAQLDFDSMIGTAPPFRDALAKAAKAARGHGHVLIEGESGTGKEMLVRAMHAASPRAKAPFRIINIARRPANSIESVLFGHEKGAFPGAFDRQIGAFQHCDGGTLVLDEIDRLPLDAAGAARRSARQAASSARSARNHALQGRRARYRGQQPAAGRPGGNAATSARTCSSRCLATRDRAAAACASATGDIPAR